MEIEQDRQQRILEKQQKKDWRIGLYRTFQNSPLRPKCEVVYYPGCSDDDAAAEAFPHSEVFFVDINTQKLDALRERGHGFHVHAIEASVTDYDPPAPVDVLLLHAMDHGVDLSRAIDNVADGGFVLVMNDHAERFQRPELTLVGTINTTERDASKISAAQYDAHARTELLLSGVVFEHGGNERVASVRTDDEFRAAAPRLFKQFESEITHTAQMHPERTEAPIEYASRFIRLPMKDPSVVLSIYRKNNVASE